MRIEVSYYAHSIEDEKKFWEAEFVEKAELDVAEIYKALNLTKGICYKISMSSILDCWQNGMKSN